MSPDTARSSASPPAGVSSLDPTPWRMSWRTLLCVAAGLAYPFLVYWALAHVHPWLGPVLFLPPLWVNLALAWIFGRTLAPGREALITRFARLERAAPAPQILAYTRRLTWIWTAFFLSMAMVSGALAAFGAHEAWVWFTAVGNYLCVAALFAVEYGYRRWRFPSDSRVPPWQQLGMLRATLRDRRPSDSDHRSQGP